MGVPFGIWLIGGVKLSLMSDKYKVDSEKAMISALTIIPSKKLSYFKQNINNNVISMFNDLHVENGSFFMESLPSENLYFHDMGLRMSGGLIYKVIEPILGINDLRMMIRYAVEGVFATDDEFDKIDPTIKGHYACSFCIPLSAGKISSISGLDDISKMPYISSIVQYYHEGDIVTADKIGTLLQHFGRIKFITKSYDDISKVIEYIQNTLRITGTNGEDMIYKYFDVNRLQ